MTEEENTALLTFLAKRKKGWNPEFGARPLKRAIQKYIEDPLAEEIIKSKITEGDKIKVDYKANEEELKFDIVKQKKAIVKSK